MNEQNAFKMIDETFMALPDIHSKSSALQELLNYLQCSRISEQDLNYDSMLNVFISTLHSITDQFKDILSRIENFEMQNPATE